jgi:anti-anti-sigma factor
VTVAKVDVERTGERLDLTITGEVDLANAATVQQQLLDVITNQPTEVHLDLIGLTFLDSAGLRILFTLADRLEMLQIAFEVVVSAGSIPRRALELAGFTPLTIAPTAPAPAGPPVA